MFAGLPRTQQNIIPVRRWTALMSFTLQAALVSAAFIYPLLHPESLPPLLHPLFVPLSADNVSAQPDRSLAHGGGSIGAHPIVVSRHPFTFGRGPAQPSDAPLPEAPQFGDLGPGTPGVWQSLTGNYVPPLPRVSPHPHNFRRSVVMEGNLIHKVEPQYPPIAKQIGIQGSVVVKAWISRDGSIQRAIAESGQPLLARAALDAVRQWRYRPYYLNGEPIEVETEITVNFLLQR